MHGDLRNAFAPRRSGMLEIDPVEEILERSLLHGHYDLAVSVARLGYPERAAVEAFIEETKSGTIEEQDLRRFTPLAEEDEERAAARVAAYSLGHDARQPNEAPPQDYALEPD
jgi:hypothetical protein